MKKCIDCIHAEACKEMLEAMGYKVSEEYKGNAERCDTFKHKSDVVEVRHGMWQQARYTEASLYICSECDKPEYKEHRYCPHCGAKMDGERKCEGK